MSMKDVCRLRVLVIIRFSKERCNSLVARGKPFHVYIHTLPKPIENIKPKT